MSNEVCVAMCAYNAAGTVRQALDSLRAQTYQKFDLIVVDDGSSDRTAEILAEYKQHFGNMTVTRQRNGGIGVARNAAMNLSRHPWLAFIDSDDIWHPYKLESQMRIVEDTPGLDVLLCGHLEFLDEAEIESGLRTVPAQPCQLEFIHTLSSQLLSQNFNCHPASVLWRRASLVDVGGYGVDRNGEDFSPFLVMALSRRSIGKMPEVLYFARANPMSLSRSSANHYVGAMARIFAIDRILRGEVRTDPMVLDQRTIDELQSAKQRFIRWALHGVRTGYPKAQHVSMSWPLVTQLSSHRIRAMEILKIAGRQMWKGASAARSG